MAKKWIKVDRTGIEYVRIRKYDLKEYFPAREMGNYDWTDITIAGDSITLMRLVEVK